VLRNPHDRDFEEITLRTPWTVMAYDLALDLDAEQLGSPRLFKSHDPYTVVPKGGRYVYVMRSPMDVLNSFHKFLLDFFDIPIERISLTEFFKSIFAGSGTNSGTYMSHIRSWLPHFEQDNVCVLFYEDLHQDVDTCIKRISTFLYGKEPTADILALVKEQSSYAYMSTHKTQFDGHVELFHTKDRIGIPEHKLTVVCSSG
jgi:hypothetical protein